MCVVFAKKYSAHQKLLQKQKKIPKNIAAGRSPQHLEIKNRRYHQNSRHGRFRVGCEYQSLKIFFLGAHIQTSNFNFSQLLGSVLIRLNKATKVRFS